MTDSPERPPTPDPPAPPGHDVEAPDIRFTHPEDEPDTSEPGQAADGSGGTVPAGEDVNTDAVSPEPPD
jgi:hypothetical protein